MKGAFSSKFVSICLVAVLLLGCIPSILAVNSNSQTSNYSSTEENINGREFVPGELILVTAYPVTDKCIRDLLPGFDFTYIGNPPDDEVDEDGLWFEGYYHLRFSEKTKEIVFRALELLQDNPKPVISAHPVWITGTTSATSTIPNHSIVPGEITIQTAYPVTDRFIRDLLPDFEFTYIGNPPDDEVDEEGLGFEGYYHLSFTEKSEEVVFRALDILKKQPMPVIAAHPVYVQPTTSEISFVIPTDNSDEYTTAPYEPSGIILVDVIGNVTKDMLEDIEVTKISWLGNYINNTDNKIHSEYEIFLAENTEENMQMAIDILLKYPNVCRAVAWDSSFGNIIRPTNPDKRIIGDADSDGRVTVRDATLTQKYIAGIVKRDKIDYEAANISGSGTLSVRDATLIQKAIAGF